MIPRCTHPPITFQKRDIASGAGKPHALLASRTEFGFSLFRKKKETESLETQLEGLGKQAWKSFKRAVFSGALGAVSGIAGFFFPPIWALSLAAGLVCLHSGYKLFTAFPSQVLQGIALQGTAQRLSSDPQRQQEISKELIRDLDTLYKRSTSDKQESKKLGYAYIAQWAWLTSLFVGAQTLSLFQKEDHQLKIPLANLEMAIFPNVKDVISKEMDETHRQYASKAEVSLPEAYTIARQWMKAWVANLPKK